MNSAKPALEKWEYEEFVNSQEVGYREQDEEFCFISLY